MHVINDDVFSPEQIRINMIQLRGESAGRTTRAALIKTLWECKGTLKESLRIARLRGNQGHIRTFQILKDTFGQAAWSIETKGKQLHRVIVVTKRKLSKKPALTPLMNCLINLSNNEKTLCNLAVNPRKHYVRMCTAVHIMLSAALNNDMDSGPSNPGPSRS